MDKSQHSANKRKKEPNDIILRYNDFKKNKNKILGPNF